MKLTKIHIILFLLTVATTFITGLSFGGDIISALSFSFALLFILGSHEMGHYYYGKKYGVDITPPYFIPAPPFISPIGTFGAFIKIKSPISTKRALFDIGIAGPFAGIVATVPVLIIGIKLSTIVEMSEHAAEGGLVLGTPLIMSLFSDIFYGPIPQGYDLFLHPVAFAGWVGLFVTALNLIPSGQLDGGHIVYALFSKKYHRYVSRVMIALLIIFGIGTKILLEIGNDLLGSGFNWFTQSVPVIEGWPGWILWAVLLTLMGAKHPPTMYEETDLDMKRKILGLISLLIFIGSFTPAPIKLI
ncbi:MAG: site-2 protease family protein [Deltaproteobacteria bacterium]|nr:site-2 protease family protein [Deltaproteobacteria bacterium]